MFYYFLQLHKQQEEIEMKATQKCHVSAMMDVIEIALIASIVALVADLTWVLHDIVANGMSVVYAFIGGGLFIGLVLTGVSLYKHHVILVKQSRQSLLLMKLKIQKDKMRHLRRGHHGQVH